jgi:hypothetical protein
MGIRKVLIHDLARIFMSKTNVNLFGYGAGCRHFPLAIQDLHFIMNGTQGRGMKFGLTTEGSKKAGDKYAYLKIYALHASVHN